MKGEIKLTIELVPETAWFSNVRSCVKPADWDRIRRQCYRDAGFKCEVCGGRGEKWPVECHEVWHYDDTARKQTLVRMISLCPACHEVKHIGFAGIQGRRMEATRHLAKVNNWTPQEASRYVSEAFTLWSERSRYRYELDLSFLKRLGVEYKNDRGIE